MDPIPSRDRERQRLAGWRAPLAIVSSGLIAFLTLSGLFILFAPFSTAAQMAVLVHTLIGIAAIVPCSWYLARHWRHYWQFTLSHILVLGYVGGAALLVCAVSGAVVTWQAAAQTRISAGWDLVHIVTTFAILAFVVAHVLVIILKDRRARAASPAPAAAAGYAKGAALVTALAAALVAIAAVTYGPAASRTSFPEDYSYKYGKDRPFAPSLARTADNGAVNARVFSGSLTCGTAGCHDEIVAEWEPSAHRYAAMDAAFQKIQMNMAQQNGPESTRYCGGCHDPISLFSGTKNLFVEAGRLTALEGYQEGVSCLVCHSIRKVDVKGNANYVIARPARYLFELEYAQSGGRALRLARDFLIRAYPKQHVNDLSKRLFKAPEYCAACHKQFIDQEINNVGWVQLQNQYDNWRQSRWNHPRDARRTIECRECHMPLVASRDPAAGDGLDYNRSASDGKHRSHRFIASNQMMPKLLKLRGWEKHVELTERWLRGRYEIPEIEHKWRKGAVVTLDIDVPERVRPGQDVHLRMQLASNKVGHDFPTGPLDIIQTWLEIVVTDEAGRAVFTRGTVDDKGFIDPGTFMFKAEPVDQYGNLIDRHNLWEMVGVRYRRALFPGFADSAEFTFPAPRSAHRLEVRARLRYRKADQFLVNFMFGANSGLTSPITDMADAQGAILVEGELPARGAAAPAGSE